MPFSVGFRDPDTGKHIPFVKKSGITGTARYVTLNLHQGHLVSRFSVYSSVMHVTHRGFSKAGAS